MDAVCFQTKDLCSTIMLQLAVFGILFIYCIKAEDIVVVHNMYPVEEKFSAAPARKPRTTLPPPYTKPTGSCTWDGKHVHDCHCPAGEYVFFGLIDGNVGAGMCLPYSNGKPCPPFSGESTKCIDEICFVNCYGLAVFGILITCCIKAEDIVVVHNMYPVDVNFSADPARKPRTTLPPPYTKPTGSCTWDGKHVHDCHCPAGEYTFLGIIEQKVGAGMCLPYCNGKPCPPFPGESTKCIYGVCYVNCYDPCTGGTICYKADPPFNYLCLYSMYHKGMDET
ncbi:hypothetical protein FOL47_000977 [Perkinsus chesapeaki]|uniref:Uncharacterized protein n=1 Tax=Perkinsus chesapeaki TaxID=330153 RepID=A0A7J6KUU8_PERCH|nr:hypothetical protein FOL47_000977 [Perkinsus chesapeaki]